MESTFPTGTNVMKDKKVRFVGLGGILVLVVAVLSCIVDEL